MKNTKHTPGPWKVVPTPTRKTSLFAICTDNAAPNQAMIATVDSTSKLFHFQPDHPEGNARLIAAAPDLLEACKSICIAVSDCLPISGESDKIDVLYYKQKLMAIDEAAAKCSKAIRKAANNL